MENGNIGRVKSIKTPYIYEKHVNSVVTRFLEDKSLFTRSFSLKPFNFQGFPVEFSMYLNYCRGLRFEEAPDYMYLKQLFRILFRTLDHKYDYTYDWTMLKQKTVGTVHTVVTPPQPISSQAISQQPSKYVTLLHNCIILSKFYIVHIRITFLVNQETNTKSLSRAHGKIVPIPVTKLSGILKNL